MNRIIITLLLSMSALCIKAQPLMRDMWATVPVDIVPLLTENNRLDMIDFLDYDMEASVRNILDGTSVLDTLTEHYLHCTLTPQSELQMRLLPVNDSTSVVAVVNTSRTPQPVSALRFYDTDWKDVNIDFHMPDIRLFADSCDAQALRELADMPLVAMNLSADDNTLTLTISDAPLSRDARKALNGKLHPITLYWNETTHSFSADAAVR